MTVTGKWEIWPYCHLTITHGGSQCASGFVRFQAQQTILSASVVILAQFFYITHTHTPHPYTCT